MWKTIGQFNFNFHQEKANTFDKFYSKNSLNICKFIAVIAHICYYDP